MEKTSLLDCILSYGRILTPLMYVSLTTGPCTSSRRSNAWWWYWLKLIHIINSFLTYLFRAISVRHCCPDVRVLPKNFVREALSYQKCLMDHFTMNLGQLYPLKVFLCHFHIAKKPSELYKICSINFIRNVKKHHFWYGKATLISTALRWSYSQSVQG